MYSECHVNGFRGFILSCVTLLYVDHWLARSILAHSILIMAPFVNSDLFVVGYVL